MFKLKVIITVLTIIIWSNAQKLGENKKFRHNFNSNSDKSNVEQTDRGSLKLQIKQTELTFEQATKKMKAISGKNIFEKSYYESMKSTLFGNTILGQKVENFLKNNKLSKKHKNLKIDNPYYLTNNYNTQYTYHLYVGSQVEELDVVFDTGSDWLIIISDDCTACTDAQKFDPTESTTYKELSSDFSDITYGSAAVTGLESTDDVFLDDNQDYGVEDFEFLLVVYAEGLDGLSGVHGYSRNIAIDLGDSTYVPGPLYYHYLYKAKVIDERSFAVFYGDLTEDSFVELGSSDFKSYAKSSSSIVTLELYQHFFWLSAIEGFMFDNDPTQAFATAEPFIVILDTGTSLSYIPPSFGTLLAERALANIYYENYDGFIVLECSNSFKDMKTISFYMGGYYFETPPESYIISLDGEICLFGYVPNGDEYFLFGDVFYRNFYQYYDDDAGTVKLAARKGSYVNDIEKADLAEAVYDGMSMEDWMLVLEIVGIVLGAASAIVGVLIALGVIQVKGRKKEGKLKNKTGVVFKTLQ